MEIPSVQTLKSITALAERREKLLAEVAEIEAKLTAAMGGQTAPAKKGRKPKTPEIASDFNGQGPPGREVKTAAPRGRKGGVKESIVSALNAAGDAGIRVVDLAKQLGRKPQNIHVWFATTGKALGAEKIGRGVYALAKKSETGPGNGAPAEIAETAPAAKLVRAAKPKTSKRFKKNPKKAK